MHLIFAARAREDTGKIDRGMKKKAERLQHIAAVRTHYAASLGYGCRYWTFSFCSSIIKFSF